MSQHGVSAVFSSLPLHDSIYDSPFLLDKSLIDQLTSHVRQWATTGTRLTDLNYLIRESFGNTASNIENSGLGIIESIH